MKDNWPLAFAIVAGIAIVSTSVAWVYIEDIRIRAAIERSCGAAS